MKNIVLVDVYDFENNMYDQFPFDIPNSINIKDLEQALYDDEKFDDICVDFIEKIIYILIYECYHTEFLEEIIDNICISFVDDDNYLISTTMATNFVENNKGFEFDSSTINWKQIGERIHVTFTDEFYEDFDDDEDLEYFDEYMDEEYEE